MTRNTLISFLTGLMLLASAPVAGDNTKTTVIKLLPLGRGIDKATINNTYRLLDSLIGNAVLLPMEELPAKAYTAARKRYRADTLIHWMAARAKPNELWVGITAVDISTKKGNHSDWGIMGLSYQPGKASIASTYRLKNKKAFPKIVIHETGHAFGLPHCAVETCYMVDAEGGDKTAGMTGFCPTCSAYLKKKGWNLK